MPDAPTPTPTLAQRTIEIRRTFDAPRELVWAAWTDPDQLTQWWGPRGFTTPRDSITIDLRPGGVFALTMVGPDGTSFADNGHFHEVVEHERLVFGGEVPGFELMTSATTEVTFTDLGGNRTEVVVRQTMMAAEQMPEMARAGWSSQLNRLADLLVA